MYELQIAGLAGMGPRKKASKHIKNFRQMLPDSGFVLLSVYVQCWNQCVWYNEDFWPFGDPAFLDASAWIRSQGTHLPCPWTSFPGWWLLAAYHRFRQTVFAAFAAWLNWCVTMYVYFFSLTDFLTIRLGHWFDYNIPISETVGIRQGCDLEPHLDFIRCKLFSDAVKAGWVR